MSGRALETFAVLCTCLAQASAVMGKRGGGALAGAGASKAPKVKVEKGEGARAWVSRMVEAIETLPQLVVEMMRCNIEELDLSFML